MLSQNGYVANDRSMIRSATIAGTDVKVALRKGAPGDLLLWAAARWHREVEPLRARDGVLDCWGYAVRKIRGSATAVSNHASGTALDLRARAHPLGTPPSKSFSVGQINAIHHIVSATDGALRWGGDYSGRTDPMHLEVVASQAPCADVLARLTAPGSSSTGHPTIRRGDTGAAVQLIQRFLGVVSPGGPGYGTFGPKTEAAVRKYQAMRGLAVDGIVGSSTWRETGL